MLHLIDSADGDADTVLRAMFAARKHVFVDLLKWDVPVVDDRYEIDQFDDEHAFYLVITDGTGRHLGSARLLETTRPHILDSLFPDLCDGAAPKGRDVREITRGSHASAPQVRRPIRIESASIFARGAGIESSAGAGQAMHINQMK